ncbi:hypothetical protein GF376_04175 [Candidatus Peregrinibacteria bacterium]|nr:hypothetical protein [Candidatus Peregrinibacteria bacterium]
MIKKNFLYILISFLLMTQTAIVSAQVFTTYPSKPYQGNKQWIVKNVNLGKNYQEKITVRNLTERTISLTLEFKESTGTKENFKIIEHEEFKSIGNWINFETYEIQLKPFEKKQIEMDIKIPKTAREKEYQGVILITHTDKAQNSKMNIATRIGNRVYLNVTKNSELQTNITNLTVTPLQISLILIALAGIAYGIKKNKYEQ